MYLLPIVLGFTMALPPSAPWTGPLWCLSTVGVRVASRDRIHRKVEAPVVRRL